jgi:hypothetical protein
MVPGPFAAISVRRVIIINSRFIRAPQNEYIIVKIPHQAKKDRSVWLSADNDAAMSSKGQAGNFPANAKKYWTHRRSEMYECYYPGRAALLEGLNANHLCGGNHGKTD